VGADVMREATRLAAIEMCGPTVPVDHAWKSSGPAIPGDSAPRSNKNTLTSAYGPALSRC
jgi:hypothetical protein